MIFAIFAADSSSGVRKKAVISAESTFYISPGFQPWVKLEVLVNSERVVHNKKIYEINQELLNALSGQNNFTPYTQG